MLFVLFLCFGILKHQSLASTTQNVSTYSDSTTEQTSSITSTSPSTVSTKTSESTVTTMQTTTAVNDLWCYSCSDTQRGADCQTNIKTMAGEGGEVRDRIKTAQEQSTQQSTMKYAKNCGGYANFTYCMIETIENRGEVHSYIRDCSDGTTFSYSLSKLTNVHPDNQTTCGYTGQGYVICVRLCRTNFCNGPFPLSAANSEKHLSGLLIVLYMAYSLFF